MAKAKRPGGSTLKDQFDELSLDDKATFLVQATFSTAAATIDEIGRRISELVDTMAADVEDAPDVDDPDVTPGATAPPKSPRSTSKGGSTSKSKTSTTKKKRPPKSDAPGA